MSVEQKEWEKSKAYHSAQLRHNGNQNAKVRMNDEASFIQKDKILLNFALQCISCKAK